MLLRFQALLQQFGGQFVQAGTAFLRQLLKLFYQVAFQLDRKRYQAERLIAFALLAPIDRDVAETAGRGALVHLTVDLLAFAFFQIGFFQGIKSAVDVSNEERRALHCYRSGPITDYRVSLSVNRTLMYQRSQHSSSKVLGFF